MCASLAVVIRHKKRMRRLLLSFVTSLAPPYFSTLFHKRHNFRNKVAENKTCILIFSTTFIWNISHSKKNLARYCHKCEKSSYKVLLFLSHINETNLHDGPLKKLEYLVSSMSVQWEPSCSMWTEGRTDG